MGLLSQLLELFRPRAPAAPPSTFALSVLARRFPGIKAAKTSGLGPSILLWQLGRDAEATIYALRTTFPRCWIDLLGEADGKDHPYHSSGLLANAVVTLDRLSPEPIIALNNMGGFGADRTRRGYDLILVDPQVGASGPATPSIELLQTDYLNVGGVLTIGNGYLHQATTPNTVEARRGATILKLAKDAKGAKETP